MINVVKMKWKIISLRKICGTAPSLPIVIGMEKEMEDEVE
jgi:hypothetical protein